MREDLKTLFGNVLSVSPAVYEPALCDLRFVIERHTMGRYSEKEHTDYLLLFYNKNLIETRLENDEVVDIKYFLFYILFAEPRKANLASRCIRVLYDKSITHGICNAIRVYINDVDTVCQLIYAITDIDDYSFINDKYVIDTFEMVNEFGKEESRNLIKKTIDFINKNFGGGKIGNVSQ